MRSSVKIMLLLTILTVTVFSAAGCVRDESISETPTPIPAGTVSESVNAPTSYVTDEMYKTATAFPDADISRIAAVMRRAAAGENITVAVIGGSITQGSSASKPENSYASVMARWWKESFPQSSITFINAGIGATDSYLGVHRVQEDLLAYNPDFVIVEFSVNDANTNFYKITYDNLVRRILDSEGNPAVLLLYMTMEDGTSARANHALTGFAYKLPQIAYGNVVLDCIANGDFSWKDISPDNIHPNDYGHAICGELIWKYLNEVRAAADTCPEPSDTALSALTRDAYMNAAILCSADIAPDEREGFEDGCVSWSHFNNGWSTSNGGRLFFTIKASRIGLLYYKCTAPGYGKAVIKVDGVETVTLNGDFSGGWGSYGYAEQIFADSEVSEHTIEILADSADGNKFDIFGILVTE